ncbi:hypothetical protein C8R43DRAFT_971187 [Mycena crocata]|nr:hypothetical protein C8R43DRAFT_971187 [Mycena crocata]
MNALTSERLPTLPKLDKADFITSYIQGQRAHAKSHVEEGLLLSSSWDVRSTPEKPPAAIPVGFATPILTARNEQGLKKENISSKPASKKPSHSASQDAQIKVKDRKETTTATTRNPLSKKRDKALDSDEDQAARLTERRERKRIKRAIVKPREASEPDTASSNGNKRKNRPKSKSKKPKVPSGFALMHGFNATNVGKNRLTLKPPSNVGVFKKGKASFNAKVKHKAKGGPSIYPFSSIYRSLIILSALPYKHFSEFGFLNNTKKSPEQAVSEPSSDSTSSSIEEIPESKKKAVTQQSRRAKSLRTLTETSRQPSQLSKSIVPQKSLLVESEIWDIESRASEKREMVQRQILSADQDSASQIPGTVVIDARMPAWCDRVANTTKTDIGDRDVRDAEIPDAIVIPSSPSLRPSQSASQIGHLLVKPSPGAGASHYFAQQKHTAPNPDKAVLQHIHSLGGDRDAGENHQDEPAIVLAVHVPVPVPVPVSFPVDSSLPTSTRFVVPTRKRVFANQFLPVQDIYVEQSFISEDAADNCQDRGDYMCPPNIAGTCLGTDYGDSGGHSIAEEPLHSAHYDNPQINDYVQPQISWDVNALEESWIDTYRDGECEDIPLQYEVEHEDPGYVELAGDCAGYSENAWQVGVESDLGMSYGHHGSGSYVDEGADGPSNIALQTSEEATINSVINSVYVDDFQAGYEAASWDDVNMAETLEGQTSRRLSPQDSGILALSDDVISDCSGLSTYTPRFAQGRALLMGLPVHEPANRTSRGPSNFSHAEEDVAKSLRGHWLPQRH